MDLLFPQLHFIGRDFLCDKVELYQAFLKVFEFAKKRQHKHMFPL